MTIYNAVLRGGSLTENPRKQFTSILDCVKWAESYGQSADCCDIYSVSGNRVAQYRRPRVPLYNPNIWVNAKIY